MESYNLPSEEEMRRRERQTLQNVGNIDALLSASSIEGAAQAAREREKQQAALAVNDNNNRNSARRAELSARLRQSEGALDRTAAQQRAETIATGKQQQMMNQGLGVIASIEALEGVADTVPEGEQGGLRQYAIKYGPEWFGDILKRGESPEMMDLNTRGTMLQTQVNDLLMKGVLSDQDMRLLGPLALKGTLTEDQLRNTAGTLKQILAMKFGLPQEGATQEQAPDSNDIVPQYEYRVGPNGKKQRRLVR